MRIIQGDKVALYLSGQQVPVVTGNFAVTQPTINQVVAHGETKFFTAAGLFAKSSKVADEMRKANIALAPMTEFQIILIVLQQDKEVGSAVKDFFELTLPQYQVTVDTGLINLAVDGRVVARIDPRSYDEFKQVVKDLFSPFEDPSEDDYKPVNAAAEKIAEKLRKGRERIAQQNRSEGGEGSVFASYTSVLSVGMGMPLRELFDMTPFQLYDLFNRYMAKAASDRYEKICLTPMMDTSKLKEVEPWVRNLYR
jgi:hypothetical protein